ncbi:MULTISPECIES: signal recognition particle-docking protein FtsY [Candidatus Ichthyocystis]|uniref:Signal recognition particle receptor FtsY n=1 Tax=Candidatus Ichthyocystis hellenicum TaxID=1561003 RepID=A0A0S4M298_9BURK|nr:MULTISPECIES: signal recognition particle-docking protein FtsY [Ichthyocystis]CUT17100.1 Cell division protein FtsY [Candidatus Ichthyocystis hellenicum]
MLTFLKKKVSSLKSSNTGKESPATGENGQSTWARFKNSLSVTRNKILSNLKGMYSKTSLDVDVYERIEETLILADCGHETTKEILSKLEATQNKHSSTSIHNLLRDALRDKVLPLEKSLTLDESPTVVLVCGVNGSGKTTTIGKLAKFCQNQGKSVLLAAGDTFRAAATNQLDIWANSTQVTMISQEKGEPASVAYDAIQSAKAKNIDVVIVDTAGRMSTQSHLMAELGKVARVAEKSLGKPPQEKIIIIDGTMGQNVLRQIETFNETMNGLSGIIVTKLDGSAKGGTIVAIATKFKIPVYFIGVGEKVDDLVPFSACDYVDGLIGTEDMIEDTTN